MANGRFVSTSIADDDKLNDLSLMAHTLYVFCLPHLDRDGLLDGRVKAIKGAAVPLRDEFSTELIEACVNEWVEIGLVTRYVSGRHPALHFPSFARHQQGMRYEREKPSRYDCPPGYERGSNGLVHVDVISSGILAELVPQNAGPTPDLLRTESRPSISLSISSSLSSSLSKSPSPSPSPEGGTGETGGRAGGDPVQAMAVGGLSPEAPAAPDINPEIVDMLVDPDVGMETSTAEHISQRFSPEAVRAQVDRYQQDLTAGRVRSPGVILTRLRENWPARAAPAAQDDHGQAAAERRRRKYIPDEYADIMVH